MLLNGFGHIGLAGAGSVLGRNHHVIDAHGLAVMVFKRNLGLAVGTEDVHRAVLAHFGKLLRELVCPVNGGGHKGGGFVAGKTKHHALVASTLIFGLFAQHALSDVGRLTANGVDNGAGLPVKAHFRAVVANTLDGFAHNLGQVGVAAGGNFASDNGHAGGHQGFASHVGVSVLGQQGIKNGV